MKIARSHIISTCLLVLIAAIYAVFEQFTPFEYDNFTFDSVYLLKNGGSPEFSLSAYVDYVAELRQNDNMRMANLLAIVPTLFVKAKIWFSLAVGLCMMVVVAGASKIATRGFSPVAIALFWLAYTLFLPWHNNILTGDYVLNYVFSAAIALGFAMAFDRVERRPFVTFVLAILLGAWHEGFALPMSCGIFAWIALHRGRVSKRIYAVLCVLTAVALAVFLCPGMLHRTSSEVGIEAAIIRTPIKFMVSNVMTLAMVAVIMLVWRTGILKALMQRRMFVVMVAAALSSLMLSGVVRFSGRASYATNIYAIIALGMIFWPYFAKAKRKVKQAIVVAVAMVCVLHAGVVCKWQYDMYVQFNAVMAQIEEAPGTTVFYDIVMPEDVPELTLRFPSRSTFVEPYTYESLSNYLGVNTTAVVPTSLSETSEADVSVGKGVKRVCDALYGDCALFDCPYGIAAAEVTLNDGRVLANHNVFYIMYTDKNGEQHYYLKVFNQNAENISALKL